MVQIGGNIGHYGLQSWWLNVLTEQQRNFIQEKYDHNSLSTSQLTEGSTDFVTNCSAISFLTSIAGAFESHTDLPIAFVILNQAESLIQASSDVIDLHFLYGTQAKNYYKSNDPTMNAKAPKAALN